MHVFDPFCAWYRRSGAKIARFRPVFKREARARSAKREARSAKREARSVPILSERPERSEGRECITRRGVLFVLGFTIHRYIPINMFIYAQGGEEEEEEESTNMLRLG